jgi:hypothetical protein
MISRCVGNPLDHIFCVGKFYNLGITALFEGCNSDVVIEVIILKGWSGIETFQTGGYSQRYIIDMDPLTDTNKIGAVDQNLFGLNYFGLDESWPDCNSRARIFENIILCHIPIMPVEVSQFGSFKNDFIHLHTIHGSRYR